MTADGKLRMDGGMERWGWVVTSVWVGGLVILLESFIYFDWNRGIVRGILLVATLCWCLIPGFSLERSRDARPVWRGTNALLKVAAIAVVVAHLVVAATSIARTIRSDEILLDQGQNAYGAVLMLLQGENPYGSSAMLDPYEYERLMREGGGLTDGHNALGYKYGPAMIVSYLPFVLLFGKSGIYVAHAVVFLLFCHTLLGFVGTDRTRRPMFYGAALVVALAPSHIRHNVLYLSASDLLPVAAACLALRSMQRDRPLIASLFVGLSICTKTLPGLLFVLLLSNNGRFSVAPLIGVVVAFYLPFIIWEPSGIYRNIIWFNFGRPTDSTALLHYLPGWIGSVAPFLVLALLGFGMYSNWANGWSYRKTLSYLLMLHGVVLLGAPVMHNNYFVWLVPLIALYVEDTVRLRWRLRPRLLP